MHLGTLTRMLVEGMLLLTLDVQLAVLDRRLSTTIAGHQAWVRLPRPPRAKEGIGLLGGELEAPIFEQVSDGEKLRAWMQDGASPAWGKCYYRTQTGGAASVSRCAVSVQVRPEQSLAQRQTVANSVTANVGTWCSLVLDWLEVAYGQRPRPAGVSEPSPVAPWMWTIDDERRADLTQREQVLVADGTALLDDAIDAVSLQRVLLAAGAGLRPPTAVLLRRDASRQHHAGDFRRAVLDAGTAAELALFAVLPNPKERDTLGTLVAKANRLGRLVRPTAKQDFVDVRNDAAHRGLAPSAAQAEKALSLAAEYVEAAWPRAQLVAQLPNA